MCIASAAAVASSSSEALAISRRRQIAHDGLEVEQRLEPALRDLGLVGRVLRVPARVLQHVALDDRGRDAVGVAHAEKAPPHLVLVGDLAELLEQVALRERLGEGQPPAQPDGARDGLVDEALERVLADDAKHLGDIVVVRTDVAGHELVGVLEGNGHG